MKGSVAAASLAVLFAVTGCQSAPSYKAYTDETDSWGFGRKVATLLKDEALDLTDIVQIDLSAGEGLLANVRATKLAQIGAGHLNGVKGGWNQRSLGVWKERRTEGGVSVLYYTDADLEPVHGTKTLWERGYQIDDWTILHNEDHHWLDVGASLHVLFLGADVNVSPKEAVDFVVGLVNIPLLPISEMFGFHCDSIDVADDDTAARLRKKYELGYIHQPHGLNISTSDSSDRDPK
ncbi:MAG: hypothetical protein HYR85_03325 [Planctomycetes bacterium]|nr:hypothetical protein [Planctomycetota bacterium]MBI3844477.1 hypothetical protein [Planctomycetota bacterium]